MPNPRELYKQRAVEQAAESEPIETEPAVEPADGEVASSQGAATQPSTFPQDVTPSQEPAVSPEAAASQDVAPRQDAASQAVVETAAAESGNVAGASESGSVTKAPESASTADVSTSGGIEASPTSQPTSSRSSDIKPSTSQETKAKPSPRRGKVNHKDDEKIKAARRESRKRVAKRLAIVLGVAILAIAIGGFCIVRWMMLDDESSIVGKWRIDGSDGTIEITDSKIVLNDEVSYEYVIDPASKTLRFTFGTLEGTGRYRFSVDGNQLSITDGDFDFLSTLLEDAPWTFGALVSPQANPPTLGESSMLLDRIG